MRVESLNCTEDYLLGVDVPNTAEIRLSDMGKLFAFVGSTIGGYAGWALGATVGLTTAFMVSMVGTGIGMYYGHRIAKNYID